MSSNLTVRTTPTPLVSADTEQRIPNSFDLRSTRSEGTTARDATSVAAPLSMECRRGRHPYEPLYGGVQGTTEIPILRKTSSILSRRANVPAMAKWIISSRYDNRPRKLFPKRCATCGRTIYIPKCVFAARKTCSRTCYDEYVKSRRRHFKCHNCKKNIWRTKSRVNRSKTGLKFCSRDCKEISQRWGNPLSKRHSFHRDGKASYRERAYRAYGARCQRCGYNKHKRMLDVHHTRGRKNHLTKYLEVLCVWCHVMQTRKVKPHKWNGKIGRVV